MRSYQLTFLYKMCMNWEKFSLANSAKSLCTYRSFNRVTIVHQMASKIDLLYQRNNERKHMPLTNKLHMEHSFPYCISLIPTTSTSDINSVENYSDVLSHCDNKFSYKSYSYFWFIAVLAYLFIRRMRDIKYGSIMLSYLCNIK